MKKLQQLNLQLADVSAVFNYVEHDGEKIIVSTYSDGLLTRLSSPFAELVEATPDAVLRDLSLKVKSNGDWEYHSTLSGYRTATGIANFIEMSKEVMNIEVGRVASGLNLEGLAPNEVYVKILDGLEKVWELSPMGRKQILSTVK